MTMHALNEGAILNLASTAERRANLQRLRAAVLARMFRKAS